MGYVFILLGLVFVVLGVRVFINNWTLRISGQRGVAKVISFDIERRKTSNNPTWHVTLKFPIYQFEYDSEVGRQIITVKGKSDAKSELYETTPVYFDKLNPQKKFYLPRKDFMVKFVLLGFGLGFLWFGISEIEGANQVIKEFFDF